MESEDDVNLVFEPPIEYESITGKERHLKYLNIRYQINCSKIIFTKEEIEILEKYGSWLEALFLRKISPITLKQRVFLEELDKNTIPENEYVKVWFKYIKRIEIEKNMEIVLKLIM